MQDSITEAHQAAASTCLTVEELTSMDLPQPTMRALHVSLDESLHVAAAFQLIGSPHVVGSLWETQDWASREVSITFYKSIAEKAEQGSKDSTTVEPMSLLWLFIMECGLCVRAVLAAVDGEETDLPRRTYSCGHHSFI